MRSRSFRVRFAFAFGPRNLQICMQRARITPGRFYRPISCQLTLQRYKAPSICRMPRYDNEREETGSCVRHKPRDKDKGKGGEGSQRAKTCLGKSVEGGIERKKGGTDKERPRVRDERAADRWFAYACLAQHACTRGLNFNFHLAAVEH